MNKSLKWRFLFGARLDSQHILKLLIVFNIFLGIYLLFLSTNYRNYNGHVYNHRESIDQLPPKIEANFPMPNAKDTNSLDKLDKISQDKIVTPERNGLSVVVESVPVVKASNNEPLNVDKIYDSNNKLVIQDGSNNAADSSYKHVEEDDKTLDDIDKLRIEMMSKGGNANSVIHDAEFSGDAERQANSNAKGNTNAKTSNNGGGDDLNKDVINRILDHNLHINKNRSKIIVPESINLETPWWTSEVRGKYAVLRDYIQGTTDDMANSVTLTTQGTTEFLHHTRQLCDRWEGLISVSVYAPGEDFRLSINAIYYHRQCGPKCVRERINWHLVFDTLYAPANVTLPAAYLETQSFDCNIPLDENMKLWNLKSDFRETKSLPYPINVLRNVARAASKTKYLFASDIELYPSVGIVPAFLRLLEREKNGQVPLINGKNPHVYVVPIFEVKADKKPPRTKEDLIKLFSSGDAIFFHRYICDQCQNFVDRNIWVKQIAPNNTLNVFRVTRRLRERNQWEPLYIGTNAEPFYDERLTWDGKRDKMSQMYEMCLMNYDLLILDNAFLVHAPGIKFYSVKDDAKRLPFIKANQKVHNLLLSKLRQKYGTNNKC